MSGGPNTALIIAGKLVENGNLVRIISCDSPTEGEEEKIIPHISSLLGRKINYKLNELIDGFDRTKEIKIGVNDIFFATAWWTAQIAKYAIEKTVHKQFIYLIQDFEPILHPASTFYARALETYSLNHIPLINTHLLFDHLVKENIGYYKNEKFIKSAMIFEPSLDRTKFFPVKKSNKTKKRERYYFMLDQTLLIEIFLKLEYLHCEM